MAWLQQRLRAQSQLRREGDTKRWGSDTVERVQLGWTSKAEESNEKNVAQSGKPLTESTTTKEGLINSENRSRKRLSTVLSPWIRAPAGRRRSSVASGRFFRLAGLQTGVMGAAGVRSTWLTCLVQGHLGALMIIPERPQTKHLPAFPSFESFSIISPFRRNLFLRWLRIIPRILMGKWGLFQVFVRVRAFKSEIGGNQLCSAHTL